MQARIRGADHALALLAFIAASVLFDLHILPDERGVRLSLAAPARAVELDTIVSELFAEENEEDRQALAKKILNDRKVLKFILERPRGAFTLNRIRNIFPEGSVTCER